MKGIKIEWTPEMDEMVINLFPKEYSRDLAANMGVSLRSVIRRARELGVDKESDFLEKRRAQITQLAQAAKPPHPMKGVKGWSVPGSEKYRYKKGHIPASAISPEVSKKIWETRRKNMRLNIPQEKDLIRVISSRKLDHIITKSTVKPLERREKYISLAKDEFSVRIF